MIHVEHDPVAVEVCKCNHHDDGITHVYVKTFEEIFGDTNEADNELISDLVAKYGPIDLVMSGAPCQSYSGLNSRRDRSSGNAKYLVKVGQLIQLLDRIQSSSHNNVENVLFLSENVVFKDSDGIIDEAYADKDGNSLTPMRVDAKDFGPCKRNRLYWLNVSVFYPMYLQ